MQSQERDLIAGLFGRLQQFESQPRDPEAEALIRDFVARQPASPYLLVQTVLVQEQALKAAQERIAELEAKAGAAPAAAGFLGSAPKIGPWGSQTQAAAPQAPAPSTRSPLQAAVAPAVGRRQLPAQRNGDRRRRRRRRAAVRGHPQPDGQPSRPVRLGRGEPSLRRCCRRTACRRRRRRIRPWPMTVPWGRTTRSTITTLRPTWMSGDRTTTAGPDRP